MNKNLTKISIKKIDDYIHEIDPLGLGGAPGEYSDVIFGLYRNTKEKKGEITEKQIKDSFAKEFGDLSNLLNTEDLISIRNFIQEVIISENAQKLPARGRMTENGK